MPTGDKSAAPGGGRAPVRVRRARCTWSSSPHSPGAGSRTCQRRGSSRSPRSRCARTSCLTSAPLETDLAIAGEVVLPLEPASSAEDRDWTARLAEVDAHGRSTGLVDGIVRALPARRRARPAPAGPPGVVPAAARGRRV
ncbi:CocE/NonD family hydrolase C-terminal non-catalytic domain-containing protein [Actinomadura sp. NPDC048021]|uniref:CocE/NonD family hydrolase C-terminal non-catalytic domain-containing protein n=1 Tax=Actinomadura sp. NPDC048021 TaxID=3155385 RepID=UPI00340D9CF4